MIDSDSTFHQYENAIWCGIYAEGGSANVTFADVLIKPASSDCSI